MAAPVPIPAPGLGPLDQHLSSATAVDARARRPGDMDLLLGSIACMAAGPYKLLPSAAASAVVSCARDLQNVMPEDNLSFNEAWN